VQDGIHDVYFCELLIGRYIEKTMKIEDVIEKVPVQQTVVECGNPKKKKSVTHVPGIKCHPCPWIIPIVVSLKQCNMGQMNSLRGAPSPAVYMRKFYAERVAA
jgi:hypothetical protein